MHHGAAVDLSEVIGRLAVFFRGLGGGHSVDLRPAGGEVSRHRLSFLRRLGAEAEILPRASFDGETLRLPERLAVFPSREANGALYLWLTAAVAHAIRHVPEEDPLRADLNAIAAAHAMVDATLVEAPGLRDLYQTLCAMTLHQRATARLPRDRSRRRSADPQCIGRPGRFTWGSARAERNTTC